MSFKKIGLSLTLLIFLICFGFAHAQQASQTLNLKQGFNFISFTVKPGSAPSEMKNGNWQIEDIFSFSPASGSFLSVSEGNLVSLSAGRGYIIKTASAFSLNVSGTSVTLSSTAALKAGFNLIGVSKAASGSTFTSFMNRFDNVLAMYKWSAVSGSFIQALRKTGGAVETPDGIDPQIIPAQAYFVNSAADAPVDFDQTVSEEPGVLKPATIGKEEYLKVYHRVDTVTGNIDFYADNSNYASYQFEVKFSELKNATTTSPVPFYYIIAPQKKEEFLFSMVPDPGAAYSYKYEFNYYLSGSGGGSPDDAYKYLIPYEAGTAHKLTQGYNGALSHNGWMNHSVDFDMPEGTKICAARDGVVVSVKTDSDTGGPDMSFKDNANYIIIEHSDGTNAQYVHLKKGGSYVAVGDKVSAGSIIGLSGNTGWSTGPHLHFMIVKPIWMAFSTIPVKFLGEGGQALDPSEDTVYTSYR